MSTLLDSDHSDTLFLFCHLKFKTTLITKGGKDILGDMEETETFVNYYEILKSERDASTEDIKKNYQRLALVFHPDKIGCGHEESFYRIQNAWSVLRDPDKRKQYDAMLSCYESSDFLLYNTISLSEMNYNSEESAYSYMCRCSGIYYLEDNEIISPKVIIHCNECSFSILINIPEDGQNVS